MNWLLVAALCVLAGALGYGGGAAAWIGFGLCLACLWRQLGVSRALWCMLLFALSGWRAQETVAEYYQAHELARMNIGAPQRCVVVAEVLSSPSERQDSLGFTAQLLQSECETTHLPEGTPVRLYGGPPQLARGDRFEAIAQLGVVRIFRNPDLPDPFPGYARRQVTLSGSILSLDLLEPGAQLTSWIDRARAHVRERIERTFSAPAVGMAKALVLGENDLTKEEDAAFKGSGLAHLLAVSGTHLVFAVVSLVEALRQLLVRFPSFAAGRNVGRWAAAAGVPLSLLYADFAGGSGSAWRAAWMLSAAFLLRALGRELGPARAVAASIWVGWIYDPLAVFDLSFMLSLAATSGLLTIGRRWSTFADAFSHRGAKLVVTGTVATVASMLPCAAFLALLSPRISLVGIVANVFAGPFGEVIALPLCLAHALLSFWPALESGTAAVASGALLVVKQVALTSDALGWISVSVPFPGAWQLVALSVASVGAALTRNRVRWLWIAGSVSLLGCLEWRVRALGSPTDELRVTIIDVGQGDSSLVDLPDGRLMLIDGGGFVGSPVDPGERVLLPLLRARRRDRVDVMVLSHPHPDHFGGLLKVAQTLEVGEFWDTGQGEKEGAGPQYRELLDTLRRRGTRVRRPEQLCGEPLTYPMGAIQVLGPCPSFTPGRDANDNSLVLRISYGERAVLFTGDAEHEQETELLHAPKLLRADLLKVGHHGSRTSTGPEFLAAVQPSFATISCGMRNRFGHPHGVTLSTLNAAAVPHARIDETGGLLWRTDGENIHIDRFETLFSGP